MNIAPISNNYYDEVNQVCAAPQVADEKTAAATPLPESKPPVSAKHEPTLWEIMFTGRQRKGAPGCAVNDEGKPTAPPVTAAETAVSTGISTSAPTSTPTSTDTSTATGTPAPITPGPDAGSYTPPNTFDTDTGTGINVTPTEIVPPPPDAGAGVSPPDVMPTIISTTDAVVNPDLVQIVMTDTGPIVEPDQEFMFDKSGTKSQLTNMILTDRVSFNASGRKDQIIKIFVMPTPEMIDPRLAGITGLIDMTEVPCKKAPDAGLPKTMDIGTNGVSKCIRNPFDPANTIPAYVGETYFEDLTGKVPTPDTGPLQSLCTLDQAAANQCESVRPPYDYTVTPAAYNNNIGSFRFGSDFTVNSENYTEDHNYRFAFKFAMQTLVKETK